MLDPELVAQNSYSNEAIADIAKERARQISAEGWTPEHDDEHGGGDMALAASCYANLSGLMERSHHRRETGLATTASSMLTPIDWPWDEKWWKPKTTRENLVRAGALIVAEIERLDRALKRPRISRE